jgi:hypothetical protein
VKRHPLPPCGDGITKPDAALRLTPGRGARIHVCFLSFAARGPGRGARFGDIGLDPVGPVGARRRRILIDATLIMLAIVIPTILLAFWMAWRYRASNTKAEYLPYWSYSGRIEAVVWSIPILTIMFIGGVIWIGSYRLDPFRPLPSKTPPLEVQVVSLDWKWLFIYPQQGSRRSTSWSSRPARRCISRSPRPACSTPSSCRASAR